MKQFVIRGGRPLYGSVEISGGKNAALAIIPATLLVDGVCRLENVPDISDVSIIFTILARMGAVITRINRTCFEIDTRGVATSSADFDEVRKMRASYYLIGALLGRGGKARVGLPGGCDLGVRPINFHIKGFNALGADVSIEQGTVVASAEALTGTSIYLDQSSVGATINIMLAAVKARGQTIIENPAKEPHVVDVANFLNMMGANIRGAGTDVIKIRGVDRLGGGSYAIIPDQIEAGTYMVAAAMAGGELRVENVIPKHMDSLTAKLTEAGISVVEDEDTLIVSREPGAPIQPINVRTLPYPGFPTDLQPQIATMLTVAKGVSMITESIFDNRFKYIDELKRMGAKGDVDGRVAIINGVEALHGATVRACDLRAGAAMIIAGLAADGKTVIEDVHHIERGYENIIEKLRAAGADIEEVFTEDNPSDSKAVI